MMIRDPRCSQDDEDRFRQRAGPLLHPAWKFRLTIYLFLIGPLALWLLGHTITGLIVGIVLLTGCIASGVAAFRTARRSRT